MRFFKSNKGITVPFKVTQGDGVTAKNLTGITVKWYFKKRDNTVPTGSPITGTVTDAVNGLVNFLIPANIFDTITDFDTCLNLNNGTTYNEDTEPFTVDVDKSPAT